MNKKGQYQMPQRQYSSVSPILIIGIVVFVVPFFKFIIPFTIPKWISVAGLILIGIGAIHSIMLANGD